MIFADAHKYEALPLNLIKAERAAPEVEHVLVAFQLLPDARTDAVNSLLGAHFHLNQTRVSKHFQVPRSVINREAQTFSKGGDRALTFRQSFHEAHPRTVSQRPELWEAQLRGVPRLSSGHKDGLFTPAEADCQVPVCQSLEVAGSVGNPRFALTTSGIGNELRVRDC
jgi:hypothetical protein